MNMLIEAEATGFTSYEKLRVPDLKLHKPQHGNSGSNTNTKQLEKRFTYLWQSAHALLPTSVVLANQMIASMIEMARQTRTELPAGVMDFICEKCGGFLMPSVSANVKVVPQTLHSKINRRLLRRQQQSRQSDYAHNEAAGASGSMEQKKSEKRMTLANVVRITCKRCQHANDRPGASVAYETKAKKRANDATEFGQRVKRQKREDPINTKQQIETLTDDQHQQEGETIKVHQKQAEHKSEVTSSIFARPPSPPRKLLDGPKKKKKKNKQTDAAVVAVKSSLNSFLQNLHHSSK